MAYIGNTAANRFVAPQATTRLSGNGSTTAFTLEHAVGSDEDILVSVDGVIQEPSEAYAVSNGTTLTFTAAPSSGTNNIFVCYLFRTVGTVSHPSNNALTATTGTFTGAFTSLGIDDNADATAITIDSSEKVGIGQTTPTRRLHIKDTSADMYIGLEGGTSNNVGILMGDTDNHTLSRIRHDNSDNALEFHTNETERARFNSTGYFHVSQDISDSEFYNVTHTNSFSHSNTQPVLFLENSGDGNVYGLGIDFSDATPDNNTSYFMVCQDATAVRLKIWADGDIQNHDNSYGALSDEKLKEQIADASSQWEDIKALKVRKFKMKEDVAKGDSDDHWRLGVIAQELETAGMNGLVKDNPELVTNSDGELEESGTTTKSVKYSILYMKAVKALQEAMARIETLEAKVTALESK